MDGIAWRWGPGHFGCVARRLNCVKDRVPELTGLNWSLGACSDVTVLRTVSLKVSETREMMHIKMEN